MLKFWEFLATLANMNYLLWNKTNNESIKNIQSPQYIISLLDIATTETV